MVNHPKTNSKTNSKTNPQKTDTSKASTGIQDDFIPLEKVPWYVYAIIQALMVIIVTLNSFVVYRLSWIFIPVFVTYYAFLSLLFSTIACNKCNHCSTHCFLSFLPCPRLFGKKINITTPYSPKQINYTFMTLLLLYPFVITIVTSILTIGTIGTFMFWPPLLLFVLSTIIAYFIYPRVRKQIACFYCYKKSECYSKPLYYPS